MTIEQKLYYLATPYTGHRDVVYLAYRDALLAAGSLIDLGLDIFSPVAHFHQVSFMIDSKPHSFWMERCMAMLQRCDEMLVVKMPGWKDSSGIAQEMREFQKLGRNIWHLPWPIPVNVKDILVSINAVDQESTS